jgi:hypothetical protein
VLAQYLRAHNIDFEIFERDESVTARVQGWAIVLVGRCVSNLTFFLNVCLDTNI